MTTGEAASSPLDFPEHWRVSAPRLIAETFSSRIWEVRREGGGLAIVKHLKPIPDVEDELRGAHLLAWRDGVGAVRLLDVDGYRMLLEHAGHTTLVDCLDADGDRAATKIATAVVQQLHAPSERALPGDLQPLADRFASLFRKAEAVLREGGPSIYPAAADVAERLLANQTQVRPLHGDLHHENIMHGPRGWLAIDPKGVLGDPGFDVANLFYNPIGRDDLCLDPGRIAFMAETFASVLGRSARHVLDYAFAYGCLSSAWHAEDGNERNERAGLLIAAAILNVREFRA